MNIFDRILRPSQADSVLATGQMIWLADAKEHLQIQIDFVAAQGTGFVVRVPGRDAAPKDQWLADAAIKMAYFDNQIADAQQYII